ncbi:MAG: hypothetical protein HC906_13725 [Bacteroidales bacterium]|nr:hypothetical protein [Bacteroidales bacterium]
MKKLPFSILVNNELYTLSSRIYAVLFKNLPNDAHVKDLIVELKKWFENLAAALGKALGSDYTDMLFIYDRLRDRAFVSFRDYIGSETNSDVTERENAALSLEDIIHNVGFSIQNLGYVAETSKLNALFREMNKPESISALNIIEAAGRYERLKNAQDLFEKTYNEKN